MASGPSRRSRPPPGSLPDPRQPHVRDAEIAAIFRDMRRASQQTKDELARRFATTVGTIEALEAGELLALPEWPETSRVVRAYAEALGLDPRPILRRIHTTLLPAGPARPRPPTRPDRQQRPATLVAERRVEPPEAVAGRGRGRRRRRVLPWVLLFVILAATFGVTLAIHQPHLIRSVIDQMPDPIPRLTRAGLKPLEGVATTQEAQEDPRSRKADKLPRAGSLDR